MKRAADEIKDDIKNEQIAQRIRYADILPRVQTDKEDGGSEMIGINDVKSEFVTNKYGRAIPLEDLIMDWEIMTYEERENWYTATVERKKFDARYIIEDAIYKLSEDEGYDDMEDICLDMLTDEQTENLQKVLDSISNNSAYDVYYEGELIDPNSEVVK